MRRIIFTENVKLVAVFGYEHATEVGEPTRLHYIEFKKGEAVNLYEWGWEKTSTNFASDDPAILGRVQPGDSSHDVVVILDVPYDCHESEPAFMTVEESFRVKTPVVPGRKNVYHFLPDSGSPNDEDLVDSVPAVASTA